MQNVMNIYYGFPSVKVHIFSFLKDTPVATDYIPNRVAPYYLYYHCLILKAVSLLSGIIVLIAGHNVHTILNGVAYVFDVSVEVFNYAYNRVINLVKYMINVLGTYFDYIGDSIITNQNNAKQDRQANSGSVNKDTNTSKGSGSGGDKGSGGNSGGGSGGRDKMDTEDPEVNILEIIRLLEYIISQLNPINPGVPITLEQVVNYISNNTHDPRYAPLLKKYTGANTNNQIGRWLIPYTRILHL